MDATEKRDEVSVEKVPFILQRGVTKGEFMPEGEPSTNGKTGTWEDVDQD